MKLRQLTRIVKEDFAPEYQELIGKLAFALNPLLEQISTVMNKNVDFDNLNRSYVLYTTTVDANGIPSISELTNPLNGRPKGIYCMSARNLTNSTSYPTSSPFISFTFTDSTYKTIKISHIAGLPANEKFELALELIG